jgi:hypothetical protein
MDVQQIIAEVSRLPLTEQQAVSAAISINLSHSSSSLCDKAQATEKLLSLLQQQPAQVLSADWDWKQAKADHLTEKYMKS